MPTTALKGAHLSLQQDHLWSLQRESRAFRSQCTIRIKGTLNWQVFQQALQQIVEQHAIFRTVFCSLPGMDLPVQVIGYHVEFCCPVINLAEIAEPEQTTLLDTLFMSLQEEPFDLEHGPLLRTALFRLSADTALLLISLPALCADASTLPLLVADLTKRYTAYLSAYELSEEPLQYTAVSAWQKQLLLEDDEEAKAAREFWQKFGSTQMSEMQSMLEKLGGQKRSHLPATQQTTFEPLTLTQEVEETVAAQAIALASRHQVSVKTLVLACWLIVLWRLTGEAQLVIGVACDGRNYYEELADALGLYTRFVPFDAYLKDSWTFEQVLTFVETLLERTRRNETYFSWPSVPNANASPTGPSCLPVTFEYESWPVSFTTPNSSLSLARRFCCTEPFALKLSTLQVGERLQLELHYDPQRIAVERVSHLASLLQTLLHSAIQQPQAPIGALTMLTVSEQSRLLTMFRAPNHSLPTQGLHHLFEAHAKCMPDQPAVISAREQLTYQQLNERANRLAQVLRLRGIGPNSLVGLCMTRGAQMLVGLLGILKAGGAYVPLDAESPPARLAYQLQDSQIALLLTQQEVSTRLPQWERSVLYLETLEQEMSQVSASNVPGGSEAEDIAYVIYTSGSTGKPKGVMIRQSSIVNYTLALCEELKSEPGWQYATVSTLAADLGNTAIFCALASGGCVQIPDSETITSVEAMARWMGQHPVDVLKIVPSHLSALLAGPQGKELLPKQALVLGGEILEARLLEQIQELGGTCQVYNHYGPTETTIGVLVRPLGSLAMGKGEQRATIPLGRPISNSEVYVLDERMQVVPEGVTGELYIGGAGLALGYVGQAEQTAERFVPHPYNQQAGARLYRTGDLVRYGQAGEIEFVGRGDNQIKLRGYRIELAEIEALLKTHPNVRDSVVVLRANQSSTSHLVSYIVPRNMPVPASTELRDWLRQHLPEYMVPSVFVYLKFLPLTANGKVDRRQLSATDTDESKLLPSLLEPHSTARTVVQPRDVTEWQLLEIWEDLLQVQSLSIFDNFFTMGGHSLLAVRLMSRIAQRFGTNLDLAILFQYPTVAELAVVLRRQTPPQEDSPIVAIQPQGSRPPFFCVHPSGGTAFCYVNLARRLGPDQPFYGLHTPDLDSVKEALGTVEEVAARYIAAIQTVEPQGPYLLGGWSAGGIIAFEMAQQLQTQGHEVGMLAIIDSAAPSAQVKSKAREEQIDLSDAGVVKELVQRFKITIPDDFSQRKLDEQLRYATEQAKKMQAIPSDTSIDLLRRYVSTAMRNKHAVHLYTPDVYKNHIDYFISIGFAGQATDGDNSAEARDSAARQDQLQSWRELAQGGMAVHLIPGNHQGMVEEPNVQILARELKSCIDRVCERSRHNGSAV